MYVSWFLNPEYVVLTDITIYVCNNLLEFKINMEYARYTFKYVATKSKLGAISK